MGVTNFHVATKGQAHIYQSVTGYIMKGIDKTPNKLKQSGLTWTFITTAVMEGIPNTARYSLGTSLVIDLSITGGVRDRCNNCIRSIDIIFCSSGNTSHNCITHRDKIISGDL